MCRSFEIPDFADWYLHSYWKAERTRIPANQPTLKAVARVPHGQLSCHGRIGFCRPGKPAHPKQVNIWCPQRELNEIQAIRYNRWAPTMVLQTTTPPNGSRHQLSGHREAVPNGEARSIQMDEHTTRSNFTTTRINILIHRFTRSINARNTGNNQGIGKARITKSRRRKGGERAEAEEADPGGAQEDAGIINCEIQEHPGKWRNKWFKISQVGQSAASRNNRRRAPLA